MTPNESVYFFFCGLLLLLTGCSAPEQTTPVSNSEPLFSFGLVADAQYADKEPAGDRHYRSSLGNLEAAVQLFNEREVAFVAHLGDLIDEDFLSYNDILPIFNQLASPGKIVLGNHEFSVAEAEKKNVVPRLGLEARYYDFVVEGWRFIALDGQGLSTFAPADGALRAAEELLQALNDRGAANAYDWNGGVDAVQLQWLQDRLELATQNEESVVLFSHFPVFPHSMTHNLWNDREVTHLLTTYPVVKAWFNGHNHAGFTGILDGIHFVTLKGMVNHPKENAFSIAHVYSDRIVVEGMGAEDTRIIPLRGAFISRPRTQN